MAFRVTRLSSQDVGDPAKLAAFIAELNEHEKDAIDARLLPSIDITVPNDGSVFAVVKYAISDAMRQGAIRPAFIDEIEHGLAKVLKRKSSGPDVAPRLGSPRILGGDA